MAYLESHLHLFLRSLPGIIRNEMKIVHTEFIAVLQCRITSAGHVNPFSSTSLRTTNHGPPPNPNPLRWYGMKPIAPMLAQLSTVSNSTISLPFAKNGAQIIIINLSQKADALTVTTSGAGQSGTQGYVTNLILHQSAQWKHQFGNFAIIYLCQKVGLVFHGIGSGTEPCLSIPQHRSGVVPGCRDIEILPPRCSKHPNFISLLHITSGLGSNHVLFYQWHKPPPGPNTPGAGPLLPTIIHNAGQWQKPSPYPSSAEQSI